jgi:hypothetical protein
MAIPSADSDARRRRLRRPTDATRNRSRGCIPLGTSRVRPPGAVAPLPLSAPEGGAVALIWSCPPSSRGAGGDRG